MVKCNSPSSPQVDAKKAAILNEMKEKLENLSDSELKYIAGALAAFTAFESDSKKAGLDPPDKAS